MESVSLAQRRKRFQPFPSPNTRKTMILQQPGNKLENSGSTAGQDDSVNDVFSVFKCSNYLVTITFIGNEFVVALCVLSFGRRRN